MPPKKRIVFVANTSWSIYKFRFYLLQKLLEQGFSVFVLAPRDGYTGKFELMPGLSYIELATFGGLNPLQDLGLLRELKQHYRRIKPDIIFHYTIKANIWGSIAAGRSYPSISVVTGLGYAFSEKKWLRATAKALYKIAFRRNKEIWFLNEDDRHFFLHEKLVEEKKTFLLPGEGVDAHAYYPAPYEHSSPYEQEQQPVTFLLIARIIRHKGIYEFVRAAELLQKKGLPIQCQLLGFFDDANPVAIPRQQVAEWENRNIVRYLGQTDDVTPFIKQADCIVLPSYREGMPLSLLEGASMCKALIAADTAGCRAIVRDGINGYLCKKQDSTDLADKMEKYYQLPAADKRQMGLAGRADVLHHFTREIVAGIYVDKIKAIEAARQES